MNRFHIDLIEILRKTATKLNYLNLEATKILVNITQGNTRQTETVADKGGSSLFLDIFLQCTNNYDDNLKEFLKVSLTGIGNLVSTN